MDTEDTGDTGKGLAGTEREEKRTEEGIASKDHKKQLTPRDTPRRGGHDADRRQILGKGTH
jgi:hypothetical protein